MRAALIENSVVVNLIEYDPNAVYSPGDNTALVEVSSEVFVDIGSRFIGGEFLPPPIKILEAEPIQILADNTSASIITYTNTHDNSPTEALFDVNGALATVDLVDGSAQLEVTSSQPGDILVRCDGLEVVIAATEVN